MSKIIHFIWVDKYDLFNTNVIIPIKYEKNIDNWKKIYNDWTIKVWNGNDLKNLIDNINNKNIQNTFFNYKHFISKLDFIRFLILYLYGGLYIDCDIYLLKKYDFSLHNNLVMVKEPNINVKNNYPGYDFVISNSMIYSYKNNNNILKILEGFINRIHFEKEHILLSTGPASLRHIYNELDKNDILFLNYDDFLIKKENSFSYTTYDNTWTTSKYFTEDIFNEYFYYPCLGTQETVYFPEKDNSNFLGSGISAVEINNNNSIAIYTNPSFSKLYKKYDSEFSGIFIKKTLCLKKALIPKIIHQIWIGPYDPPLSYINTVKNSNPTWQHILWRENDIIKEFGNIFSDMDIIKHSYYLAGKVDIIRLLILNKFGGIYVNCDAKQKKGFDDHFLKHNFFLFYENLFQKGTLLINSIMGSIKNNPIIDNMFKIFQDYDPDYIKSNLPHFLFGPCFLNKYILENPNNIFIYPNYYINLGGNNNLSCENTFLKKYNIITIFDPETRDNYNTEISKKINHRDNLGYLLNHLNLINNGVEIGVQKGIFSKTILEKWKGNKLYMVDCWEEQDSSLYIDGSNHNNNIQNEFMNIAINNVKTYTNRYEIIKKYSVDASKNFDDCSLDFIYIDARHDYNGVLEDLEYWYPKVKSGGLISGHDYTKEDGIHTLNHFDSNGNVVRTEQTSFFVRKAVNDFVKKIDLDITINETNDEPFLTFYFIKPFI